MSKAAEFILENTGADSTRTLVYQYGAFAPIEGKQFLDEEVLLLRAGRDAMIRAVNESFMRIKVEMNKDPAIREVSDKIRAVGEEIGEFVKKKRSLNSVMRAKFEHPFIESRIKELKKQKSALWKERKALEKPWYKEHKDFLKGVEDELKMKRSLIFAQTDAAATSKEVILNQQFNTTLSTHRKKYGLKPMEPADPSRKDGAVYIKTYNAKGDRKNGIPRIDGVGVTLDDIFGKRLSDVMVDPVDFDVRGLQSEERDAALTVVTMRLGRNAKDNKYIRFPVILNRPLPEGSRIVRVQYAWRKEGEGLKYHFNISFSAPAFSTQHPSQKAIGIDVGWREQSNGSLQIATMMDSDSGLDLVFLPKEIAQAMEQVERLKSNRDEETNKLAEFWYEHPQHIPERFHSVFDKWKPGDGLKYVDSVGLYESMRRERKAAKERGERVEYPAVLEHWYKRFDHLHRWYLNLSVKTRRQRKEHYRLQAKYIAENFSLIGIEDVDWSLLARNKKVKDSQKENKLSQRARYNRTRAGISFFLAELERAAAATGAEIVKVKGASTQHCHSCGHKNAQYAGTGERVWQCGSCGVTWDRDLNAAQNIVDAVTGKKTALKLAS